MVWKATVLGLLVIIVVCWVLWGRRPTLRSVAIVVLGDVGRSPRMMYHAQSFASIDFETYIVGYQGEHPVKVSEGT